ncbi:hypothetical protein F2Q69_00031920 [Brassica cretica]|uniref:Uncharacterized protein n=1 Tax=Brassica cretica TaxID=69181 RepID=A0A8S9S1B2_BRACR|nr:hypothetical protein F2Q69_00031920 [Brassica cretica]
MSKIQNLQPPSTKTLSLYSNLLIPFLCNGETTGKSEQGVLEAQRPNRSRNRSEPVQRITPFLKKGSKTQWWSSQFTWRRRPPRICGDSGVRELAARDNKKSDDRSPAHLLHRGRVRESGKRERESGEREGDSQAGRGEAGEGEGGATGEGEGGVRPGRGRKRGARGEGRGAPGRGAPRGVARVP